MSANLGVDLEDDHLSPLVFKAKTVLVDEGDELVNVPNSAQVGLLNCIKDGSGFDAGVAYVPVYDPDTMLITEIRPIFRKHLHNTLNDMDGGTLLDIKHANSGLQAELNLLTPQPTDFEEFGTGGSLSINRAEGLSDRRLKLASSAVSGENYSAVAAGSKVKFDFNLELQTRIELSHNSNIAARIVINGDRLDQTQSTSRRQGGIEGCLGHGTNFVIITANGNTSSLEVTQTLLDLATSFFTAQLFMKPGFETRFYKDGVSQAASSSTSTPSNGTSDADKLLTYSVQTNTSEARDIDFWWAKIIGGFHNMFSVGP